MESTTNQVDGVKLVMASNDTTSLTQWAIAILQKNADVALVLSFLFSMSMMYYTVFILPQHLKVLHDRWINRALYRAAAKDAAEQLDRSERLRKYYERDAEGNYVLDEQQRKEMVQLSPSLFGGPSSSSAHTTTGMNHTGYHHDGVGDEEDEHPFAFELGYTPPGENDDEDDDYDEDDERYAMYLQAQSLAEDPAVFDDGDDLNTLHDEDYEVEGQEHGYHEDLFSTLPADQLPILGLFQHCQIPPPIAFMMAGKHKLNTVADLQVLTRGEILKMVIEAYFVHYKNLQINLLTQQALRGDALTNASAAQKSTSCGTANLLQKDNNDEEDTSDNDNENNNIIIPPEDQSLCEDIIVIETSLLLQDIEHHMLLANQTISRLFDKVNKKSQKKKKQEQQQKEENSSQNDDIINNNSSLRKKHLIRHSNLQLTNSHNIRYTYYAILHALYFNCDEEYRHKWYVTHIPHRHLIDYSRIVRTPDGYYQRVLNRNNFIDMIQFPYIETNATIQQRQKKQKQKQKKFLQQQQQQQQQEDEHQQIEFHNDNNNNNLNTDITLDKPGDIDYNEQLSHGNSFTLTSTSQISSAKSGQKPQSQHQPAQQSMQPHDLEQHAPVESPQDDKHTLFQNNVNENNNTNNNQKNDNNIDKSNKSPISIPTPKKQKLLGGGGGGGDDDYTKDEDGSAGIGEEHDDVEDLTECKQDKYTKRTPYFSATPQNNLRSLAYTSHVANNVTAQSTTHRRNSNGVSELVLSDSLYNNDDENNTIHTNHIHHQSAKLLTKPLNKQSKALGGNDDNDNNLLQYADVLQSPPLSNDIDGLNEHSDGVDDNIDTRLEQQNTTTKNNILEQFEKNKNKIDLHNVDNSSQNEQQHNDLNDYDEDPRAVGEDADEFDTNLEVFASRPLAFDETNSSITSSAASLASFRSNQWKR